MENKRGSWASNLGFLMAAIGSAVGLGNIWGFPNKMGAGGGFTFLIVYLFLAVFVGMPIMVSELAMGRKTGRGIIGAYKKATKKFRWLGWLGVLAPFLIMSFYSVLGGYCLQYMSLNLAELSFGLSGIFGATITGGDTFASMLTNPFGCVIFTLLFLAICMIIVKGGISGGIEKFNKVGMPALFVMLLIVIIRSVTLPGAEEGLKFMFIPGYAVEAGFIAEAPSFIKVVGSAGGQMFFSLSLAMGAMITYGSYLSKDESLTKNSLIIVTSDTIIALMAGFAVLPAAVANSMASGIPNNEMVLGGPKLLFITLQDVFSNMGPTGPLFGVLFYLLVVIAAITSAISLMEVIATLFLDRAHDAGKEGNRTKVTLWVSLAITIEAVLVAVCGLGENGIAPATLLGKEITSSPVLMDCWLDFMDCWSEGLAMPIGAMLMSVMVAAELKPKYILEEVNGNKPGFFYWFYRVCIIVIAPVVMALVLAGQIVAFFTNVDGSNAASVETVSYIVSFIILIIGYIYAIVGNKKEA
ncbi:MAG: sodium-dependent transporter [Oscillospiraceae bacterium]